eukprot:TRINITY_DN11294_c0_g1_i1.p1 TRINITY_DN11294_c0_g1~~TRINITY_DN11294_c0_g1_i1.p1  ORF type:complete len:338 (+),score=146.90 TRINITY_DN11294_c0_g1_i1:48-1016(+)
MASGAAVVLVAMAVFISWFVQEGIVMVPEGYVGVKFRGGALQPGTLPPGLVFKTPLIETIENVQITTQTDYVSDVPCGTSGGVMVSIGRIEVVNMLQHKHVEETIRNYGVGYDKIWIFDKIHHEINQFCSKHSLREVYIDKFDRLDEMLATALQESCDTHRTGIKIIAVRVTKPIIPRSIRVAFEELEETKQQLLLREERHKLLEVENRVSLLREKGQAERDREVSSVHYDKYIMEENKKAEIAKIKNKMLTDEVKSRADAEAYATEVRARAEKELLSEAKLREILYLSLMNNTKIYFGDSIPKMWAPFLDTLESKGPAPAP